MYIPRRVSQTASPSQSPGRRGRGGSPYSEEDVYSQASPPSPQGSIRDPSFEESGGSLESDYSFSSPYRGRGQGHGDDHGEQSHGLLQLEQSQSPHTAVSLRDCRVNFRLGSERLQAKGDYRVDPPSLAQSVGPSDDPTLPMHLIHCGLLGTKTLKWWSEGLPASRSRSATQAGLGQAGDHCVLF